MRRPMTVEDAFDEMARLPADDPEAALDLYRRAYRAGAVCKSFVVTLTRWQAHPLGFMREVARVAREVEAEPRGADDVAGEVASAPASSASIAEAPRYTVGT